VQDAPADRPKQPLPEEQRGTDDREQAREDDRDDRAGRERRDSPDLAGDRRQLGLRQVDVRPCEPDRRVSRGQQLGTEAARPSIRGA
jgi:hypothetical protein